MRQLEQIVFHFLGRCLNLAKPVLLGISGGPDSLALLYLLLEFRKQTPFDLALAHIDHGWREESGTEAEQLQQLALQHQLPFHFKKICPHEMHGNLEAACREARLNFFTELTHQHGFQAVLLAHHADDQAETVLKRLLEGADLSHLASLQEISAVHGITLWRPFLGVSKAAIIKWLGQREFPPFMDSTNLDPRFLRGRFRTQIIPYLSKMFGKEVSSSLCHIGEEAQELKTYLTNRLRSYLARIEQGNMGLFLDLSLECPEAPFEIKFLLRQLAKHEGVCLSRTLVNTACDLIVTGKADRQLTVGRTLIQIDRKRVFILRHPMEELPSKTSLDVGIWDYGPWRVTVDPCSFTKKGIISGWKSVWSGKVEVVLPAAQYELGPADMQAPYPGEHASISKWWTNEKVPAFFRHCVPVIWQQNQIRHEFLTQRTPHCQKADETNGQWLHICLEMGK